MGASSRGGTTTFVGAGVGKMQTSGMGAAGIVPLLRYRDCAAAVDWLCRAFNFERQLVVDTPEGGVAFAQLSCGPGLIMVGPVGDSDLDSHLKQPDELGGASTQACYIAVPDLEEHYAHVQREGAEIILPLETSAVGSRGYSCRDLEGHIWNFGSYDPWRGQRKALPDRPVRAAKRGRVVTTMLATLVLAVAGGAVASVKTGWMPWSGLVPFAGESEDADSAEAAARQAAAAVTAKVAAEARLAVSEAALADARIELDRERLARRRAEENANAAVDRIAADIRQELDAERSQRATAQQRMTDFEAALSAASSAKAEAERRISDLEQKVAAEVRAREEAETAVRELRARVSMPQPAANGISTAAAASPAPLPPAATETGATAAAATSPETPPKPRGSVRAWSQSETKAKRQRAKKDAAAAKPSKPKPAKPPKPDGPVFNIM